jgi:Domain of unknown function (DUF4331)
MELVIPPKEEIAMRKSWLQKSWLLGALVAAAAALAVGLAAKTGPSAAIGADHLDAPGLTPPGGDLRTDITDVYAFRARSGQTVLVLNVNGLTKAGTQAAFASSAPAVRRTKRVVYNLRVDNNGDARPDVTLAIRFGRPDARGVQSMSVWRNGKAIVRGRTSAFGDIHANSSGAVSAYAGMRDDPFFFDLNGFINILSSKPGESFLGCKGKRTDAFAGTNVSSIVLELPASMLTRAGSSSIGVWATTNRGGKQIDRMGRPAIATVFIPNNPFEPKGSEPSQRSAYNGSAPATDVSRFRGEVVDSLRTLFSLNDQSGDDKTDDPAKINGLANVLLPDILTFDTAKSEGFLNGRRLADDVIDAELGLITEGAATTDCVKRNDKAFPAGFPYLAAPHA